MTKTAGQRTLSQRAAPIRVPSLAVCPSCHAQVVIESRIDPLDFVETATSQCEKVADLQFLHDQLVGFKRDIELDIDYELTQEDDPAARLELLDYKTMYLEQLAAAHRRYVAFLRAWQAPHDDQAGL